jgi:hypothetical protein
VITEILHFQTTDSVGLAIIMNEVINSFSVSKILHLADEAMMHRDPPALGDQLDQSECTQSLR